MISQPPTATPQMNMVQTPPPRNWKRSLFGVCSVGLMVVIVLAVWLSYAVFVPVEVIPTDRTASSLTVTIPAGSSASQVAEELAQHQLIRSASVFKLYLYLTNQRSNLQAGEYQFGGRVNMPQLVDVLETGMGSRAEVQVTIPEGYTSDQIQQRLHQAGLAVPDFERVVAAGQLPVSDETLLAGKPHGSTLEGYLYPDTYRFFTDASTSDVVTTMTTHLQTQLTPALRTDIAQSDLSFFEILTLASIIEKEVSSPSDRAMVADVFLKRLEIGMALQSDVTIHFITGTAIDELTTDDLATVSPYNTYLYPGLPAGPISNPGLAAIEAVLHPTANEYYYFLATPDGQTVYAKTLDEHHANVVRYLQ